MTTFKPTFFALLFFALAASGMAAPDVITIVSKKGKSMKVSLVGRAADSFVVRRASDGKQLTIPSKLLSPESKNLLLLKSKTLQDLYPPLEAAVSISKRRTSKSDSYYKRMDISGKITLENKKMNMPCPPCDVAMVFIGQDQSSSNKYQVLSNQQFMITPTSKGAVFTTDTFSTSYYYSDLYTGYKYVGYLLIVLDKKGNVLLTKTLYSQIKKAMEMNAGLPKAMMKYKKGLYLNKFMAKPPVER